MTKGLWCVAAFGMMLVVRMAAADCDSPHQQTETDSLRSNANGGDVIAQYDLGRRFEYGICSEANDSKAVYWYQKAAAQNSADAAYRLGVMHDNGWGVEGDDRKAVKYYRAAAMQNHPLAQHDLAIMFLQGTGVDRNYVNAYKWLFIAVQAGNEVMREQLHHVASLMTEREIAFAQDLAGG